LAKEAAGIEAMSDPPEETTVSETSEAETSSPIEIMSDPPEETTVSETETAQPNKVLVYKDAADYAYATADGEYWYSYEDENIEAYSDDEGWCEDFDCYQVHYDIVVNIISILKYNHYDIDYYGAEYMCADKNEYEEQWMIYALIIETDLKMYDYYKCTPRHDSALGRGTPSVLEIICEILEIEFPDYVHYNEETTEQTNSNNGNGMIRQYISEFEGTWYDASASTFIVIDGNGSWSLFERTPDEPEAAEIDHGTFVSFEEEYSTYYAISAIDDAVLYKMYEFDEGIIFWNERVFYRNDPANMGNEYYGWNDELYQRYISELEGVWYYNTLGEAVWDDYDGYSSDIFIMATPHRACAQDAQSDFSSDCTEISQAY
ncbi:MAG: hypothetical protein ACI4K7_11975, partial [Oscillospiraceae bacterium]